MTSKYDKEGVLPLLIEKPKAKSQKTLTFKLRVAPNDNANTTTFEFQMEFVDGSETPREIIQWTQNCARVCDGLLATDGPAQANIYRQTLRGTSLTTFTAETERNRLARFTALRNEAAKQARDTGGNDRDIARAIAAIAEPPVNVDDIAKGEQAVILSIMPSKALERQKRAMRRHWRKPADMPIRQHACAIQHINNAEIPMLPPFGNHLMLSDDELKDIILFGCPNSWQTEMSRQGKDAVNMTYEEVLTFMERMEATEAPPIEHGRIPKKQDKKSKPKSSSNSGARDCLHHGPNTHPTNECRTIKAMLEAQKGKGESKSFHKNKTWTKNGSNTKKPYAAKGEEMKSFLQNMVKDAVKESMNTYQQEMNSYQELNSFHSSSGNPKKRKAESDEVSEPGEVKNMDLSQFSYDECKSVGTSSESGKTLEEELAEIDSQLDNFFEGKED